MKRMSLFLTNHQHQHYGFKVCGVGAILIEHKPGFRNWIQQQIFRKYANFNKKILFYKIQQYCGVCLRNEPF